MLKHKIVYANVHINGLDCITMSESDLNEYVESELAIKLAEIIIKKEVIKLTRVDNPETITTQFMASLVVINHDDYKELRDAINKNDFQTIKDGEIIPLIDLL
jgi:hypothetical protein